jgi:hypothetical protein
VDERAHDADERACQQQLQHRTLTGESTPLIALLVHPVPPSLEPWWPSPSPTHTSTTTGTHTR